MKSFFFKLFLLITMLMMSSSDLLAQYTWTKYTGNPVIPSGPSGSWYRGVITPCVLYNTDSLRYEMWFAGSPTTTGLRPHRIGFAYSSDGISWQVRTTAVLEARPGNWDNYTVNAPYVIRENNQYKMWYTAEGPNYTTFKIGYATSPDGINWTRLDYPIMDAGNADWEAQGVGICSVLPITGGYKMWYSGLAGSTDTISIGYAVSTDGITWQRDTVNNPILRPGTAGQWDDFNIFAPRVIILDNIYYMYYGASRLTFAQYRVGLATSTDGINWEKYWDNPVLRPSLSGWDNGEVETACVIKIGNTLKLWYDASNSGTYHWQIGLATSTYSVDTLYVPQEYATIQSAINAAVDDNLVLVDEGTYVENINFKGKAITVASRFFIDGDESHIQNTIIDGSQPSDSLAGSTVRFVMNEDTTSMLCGFTITGGKGSVQGGYGRLGGGIQIFYSGPIIRNNIIENNSIEDFIRPVRGSAISIFVGNSRVAVIENNIIQNNSTDSKNTTFSSTGTIFLWIQYLGTCVIRNNRITDNHTIGNYINLGGGIAAFGYNDPNNVCYIENNIIARNYVDPAINSSGGGIYTEDIYFIAKNNIIVDNSVNIGGGIWYVDNSPTNPPYTPLIINNTIIGNTAHQLGGGLSTQEISEITNCIIWNNSTPQFYGNSATISYSDIEEAYTGIGNINSNPQIQDTTYYLLSNSSPCIDAGNPDPIYDDVEDPSNPGNPLWPAMGTLTNDIGHCGGPNSYWPYLIVTSIEEEEVIDLLPTGYLLSQNYPNPFNPSTKFRYSIPTQSKVLIKVYDILGNEIAALMDEEKSVGTYELTWDASTLPSGVYFYQLRAGDYVNTKKMILLK